MPVGPREVITLDEAIAKLPQDLVETVEEVYKFGATMPDHVRRLGCPEATIARRIGRAHSLLLDILATRIDDDAREHERVAMTQRLAESRTPCG